MGVRKNAKFLTSAEAENFVKACVLMKADIVNPGSAVADQYSRWDEYVAIHQMIQDASAPGASVVNFGHGGASAGAYSFLSWHRYFLHQFEKQLQSYVPGVMLPYWDWTDPASLMTDTFMGPNGTVSREVRSGYFAPTAPGAAGNPTPAPPWWPASLTGWRLPGAFGSVFSGALRRSIGAPAGLPSANDLHETLDKADYRAFTWALESGTGLSSGNQMHNDMHGWIGGGTFTRPGHMSDPAVSPFDPFFYLHHCNIDRLWAMWQMDGHAAEYPSAGALPQHGPSNLMYPWVGTTTGYATNVSIGSGPANIPMPNFSGLGAKRNLDTLDFRTEFDYSYDTLAIIGIGLDRTGSMTGVTPDPMVSSAPDVSKWEAAKRGVSMFLQDCETVQRSGVTYVHAGIKTFRRAGATNDFSAVFPGSGYGLVKSGGAVSRATFDSVMGTLTPGGNTPLAEALADVQASLVEAPFGGVPADENRYLAMLTDGLLTAGAPLSSISDGSFTRTAVFAMGFGTGAEVDYATLQTMVDKGATLPTQQVFHGENAGTIDKFYSNALARAIGFTTVFDPVFELFEGEHVHADFSATAADDAFLITAQGVDFDDDNWSFNLHGPDGTVVYADFAATKAHDHHAGCHACCRRPRATVMRSNARLTVLLQRDNADDACWVGAWMLVAAYRARHLDGMTMPSLGSLLFPVAAGPARGARYSRLLLDPKKRLAQRNVVQRPRNGLDTVAVSTNRNDREACNFVLNVYARTQLSLELVPDSVALELGKPLTIRVEPRLLKGNIGELRVLARMVAPARDLAAVLRKSQPKRAPKEGVFNAQLKTEFDPAHILAKLETRNSKLFQPRDEELRVSQHDGGGPHLHVQDTNVPGVYHFGVYVEGVYCPDHDAPAAGGHAHASHHATPGAHGASSCGPECIPQPFSRVLTTMVVVESERRKSQKKGANAGRKKGKSTSPKKRRNSAGVGSRRTR